MVWNLEKGPNFFKFDLPLFRSSALSSNFNDSFSELSKFGTEQNCSKFGEKSFKIRRKRSIAVNLENESNEVWRILAISPNWLWSV